MCSPLDRGENKEEVEKNNRRSIRLKGFDYDQQGYYFVTLCSVDREGIFGKICRDLMTLNGLGKLVDVELRELKNRFNVRLDEYVIMPNHIHVIFQIVGAHHDAPNKKKIGGGVTNCEDRAIRESPLQKHNKRSLLSKIVGYFKASVSRKFGMQIWQRNYFDRIIRNEEELNRVRQYIKNNPRLWYRDRNNINRF